MGEPGLRIAVTGAAGYVGRTLVRRLLREPDVARVLALDIAPLATEPDPRLAFVQRDVAEPLGDLLADHAIDTVVHLAFVLKPGRDRAAIRRTNVGGAERVLEAAARASVRQIVYLSSSTVYGAHPDNPEWLTEASPARPNPGFQYAEDKVAVERLLAGHAVRNPDTRIAVLRGCPVLGPNADNFIARTFLRRFLVGVRGADPPMQVLHEDDLADAMARCALRPTAGTYNVAADGFVRWSEMAHSTGGLRISLPAPLLYALTGASWRLRLQSESPAVGLDFIRYRWTVSADRARTDLGISLRYGAQETWDAFLRRWRGAAPGARA